MSDRTDETWARHARELLRIGRREDFQALVKALEEARAEADRRGRPMLVIRNISTGEYGLWPGGTKEEALQDTWTIVHRVEI